nr:MAG TPA: hypothetical protein [Caudoviricetes sp.]
MEYKCLYMVHSSLLSTIKKVNLLLILLYRIC